MPCKPNQHCYVCSERREITLKLNVKLTTVQSLENKFLKGMLHMVAPDVMISLTGSIVISSEEGETKCEHLFCFSVTFILTSSRGSSGSICYSIINIVLKNYKNSLHFYMRILALYNMLSRDISYEALLTYGRNCIYKLLLVNFFYFCNWSNSDNGFHARLGITTVSNTNGNKCFIICISWKL